MAETAPPAAEAAPAVAAAEPAVELSAEVKAQLVNQIEFYFSDANFRRDKFMRGEARKDPDGFIPFSVLMRFNRLKQICANEAAVVEAVAAAESSTIVVKGDKTAVRRAVQDLPATSNPSECTIYAKGFPVTATLEQLQAFFAPMGNVAMVRMRRDQDKAFKGSVFVEFASKEEAVAAAAQEGLEFEGEKLVRVCPQQEYLDGKAAERAARREADGPKRKRDGEEGAEESKDGAEGQTAKKQAVEAAPFVPGEIIKFVEVTGEVSREDFKTSLAEHGMVAFVDFSRGQPDGYVRMDTAEAAAAVLAAVAETDGVVTFEEGKTAKLSLLEGEAEEAYWTGVAEARNDKRGQKRKGGRGGGYRGGGGGRGGGGRRKSRD